MANRLRGRLRAWPVGDRWVTLLAPPIGPVTFASLGIAGSGVGTYLWRGTLTSTGTGSQQVLFNLDDGTNDNRFFPRQNATGAAAVLNRVLAGAATASATLFNVTADVPFSIGVAVLGDGSARATGGGTVQSVTGGPTAGLTTLRIGRSAVAGTNITGSTAVMRVLPGVALSDADLQAAVTALV